MPRIWEEKDSFALEKYRQTGDASWIEGVESRRFVLKDYIPFMVSDRRELVCIPKERDQPSLICTGAKRTGKSLILLSLAESAYYSMGWNIAFLNEMTRESYTCKWGARQSDEKVIEKYAMFRIPKMLPIVHVIPMTNDVRIPPSAPKWKVCLPFNEVLANPEGYLDVKDSAHYLTRIKGDLKGDLSLDSVEKLLVKHDTPKNVVLALMTRIQRLYDDGILDICPQNEKVDNFIRVKPEDDDIFHTFDIMTGLMVAGAIPILHTDHIVGNKRFFIKYLTSQVEKILINQMEHPYFTEKKKKTCLFIDELTGISRKERSGENPIIRRAVIQGGPMGLGTIYATQNPSKVDSMILSNTKYVITCQNSKTEAKVIVDEFGLESRYAQEITQLSKSHRECMAFTSENFVLFDVINNEYYTSNAPVRGTYIFPCSRVIPPRS